MKNNKDVYELIQLSRYKRLIKKYEESEKILKNILQDNYNDISVYLNLGELYFEIGKHELGVRSFLSVMHLLIREKILKRNGKVEYSKLERIRDEEFLKKLRNNIKSKLPVEESFLIHKDENLSRCIGQVFSNDYDSEENIIKVGREILMKRVNWNRILQKEVEKIYF